MDIALYTIHNCLWYTDRTIFKQMDDLGKPDPIVRPDKKLVKKGNNPKLQMHLNQDQKQDEYLISEVKRINQRMSRTRASASSPT
jgi:hypothetical protein